MDGQVNGYVKFNWPRIGERKVDHQATNGTDENIKTESYGGNGEETHRRKSSVASNHALSNYSSCHSAESSSTRVSGLVSGTPRSITPLSDLSPNLAISPMTPHSSSRIHVPTPKTQMTCFNGGMTAAPRKVPPNFGHHVAMDHIDRKFLTFYIQNWCPGRCILKDTNLWLTEFARMHDRESILAAIQCLAGTYIYDYKPQSIVRQRVNERFAVAESRLSYLLEHSAGLDRQDSMELVTLSSILSMQDIVLTERRSKLPYMPRWLQGFLQCERLLQATDLGHRFWKLENVQVDSLYNSLAVIVGRSVILAQPMMPLPAAATFDFSAEERRFGWLLYGSEKDMYEIHGGCGFSKRLLHFFSQVTYCAARLNQYRESAVVPTTAEYLYTGLMDLRQWSQQSTAWHAQREPPPIMWVREVSDDYVIQTPEEMTDITAEVWRIAGLLYLQCRLLRLPRNNPDVVGNLDDLAKCISIMPRSGFVFTAQAPLLPVFLLGLLATVPEHRAVAILWFEQVMQTPVRSSVPPLYDALKRILVWLPSEIKVPSTTTKCSAAIAERQAWWELMVSKVQKKEPEVLCLT